jgi:hypothetical protein
MTCNNQIKPELAEIQIRECERCKFASSNKNWCGKFGFWFKEPERNKIIQSSKKLITKERPRPTIAQLVENFSKAMIKWTKSGFKCVDKETYLKRRILCEDCTKKWTCPKCGCVLWAKAALTTEKCPDGLW